MVTFAQAIRLTRADNVYLRLPNSHWLSGGYYSVKDLREKYDWKKIKVFSISPKIDWDGDFSCMEFEVTGFPFPKYKIEEREKWKRQIKTENVNRRVKK